MLVSVTNYSGTWQKDTSEDYKFYHKSKSIVVPGMKGRDNPSKYPFGDIFIYTYNKEQRFFCYRNQWEKWLPDIGFNATLTRPNGTEFINFGNFKIRVSIKNKKYLEKQISPNCNDVGVTPWYSNFKLSRQKQLRLS